MYSNIIVRNLNCCFKKQICLFATLWQYYGCCLVYMGQSLNKKDIKVALNCFIADRKKFQSLMLILL